MSKLKRVYIIMVSLMCLTVFQRPVLADDWIPTTPTPTPVPRTQPKVKLSGPLFVDVVNGEMREFSIRVTNVGNTWANNVFTQAKVEGDDVPFTLEFLNRSNYVTTMSWGNVKEMKMRIIVDQDAPTGSYAVTLTHSFLNNEDETMTETDTMQIRIENLASSLKPNIILNGFQSSPDNIEPGEHFEISAWVENAGSQKANDIQVLLDGLKTDEIYMANSTNSAGFNEMGGGLRDKISYSLAVSDKAKRGSYPLVFKLKYRDKDNEEYEKEYYFYVNVGGTSSSSQAAVQVTKLTNPTGTYGVGSAFSVDMELTNTGTYDAKNIKITAKEDTDGAVVPRSASIQTVSSLAAGEAKALQFSFAPTSKSRTQNYAIGFTIEYETGDTDDEGKDKTVSYDQYIGVNVSNPDGDKSDEETDKTSIPKIIVSEYAADPIIVRAGQEFDLSMTFQNTHASKSIENIRAYLTIVETTEEKGNVFTPVNCSNTFYIDRIPPKGLSHQELRMFTVPDALPRTYEIQVNFEYQDQEYNKYEATELIGINVKQYTKLETSEITLPTDGMVDQPINIGFDFYNTGKADLYNLIIKVEGDFDTSTSSVYYGKFTMYNSNYYDGSFVPTEPGVHDGKLIISYEDDAGEQTELVHEFTLDVMEMSMPDDFMMGDMMGMEQGQSGGIGDTLLGLVKNPFVWIGIVLACAVGFFGTRKFLKNRQKGLDLDE